MRTSLENRLYMDCPEGFHILNEEGRKDMISPTEKGVCISDPVRHIIITVTWAQVGLLNGMLLGRREVSWTMSRQIEKKLKPYYFTWIDDVKRTIDGRLARGINYEYKAKGYIVSCESLVIKDEDNLFYFHLYADKRRRDEALEIFHEILDNVAIAD